jgi:hypothetical protein
MATRLPALVLLSLLCGAGPARGQGLEKPAFCAPEVVHSGRLRVEPGPFVDEAIAWLRRPDAGFDCLSPALWVLGEADADAGVDAVAAFVDRKLAPESVADPSEGTHRTDLQWAVSFLTGRLVERLERDPAFAVEKTPEFGHLRRWVLAWGGESLGEDAGGAWYSGDTSSARRQQQRVEARRAVVVEFAAAEIEGLAGHDALAALVAKLQPVAGRRPRRPAENLALTASRATDGTVTLTIENRGQEPVNFGPHGAGPPLAVEVQLADGSHRTLLREHEFTKQDSTVYCGNGPFLRGRWIAPGGRATFPAPLPQTGVPARIRLRLAGPGWSPLAVTGDIPVTPAFDAVVNPQDLAARVFRLQWAAGRRSAELRAHVRGEGLPTGLGPEDRAKAGADALRELDARHDPETEAHFRAFLAIAHPVPPLGPRHEVEGPVADVMQQLCGIAHLRFRERPPNPEMGLALIREVLADPHAPNRAAIARAGAGCETLPLVAERLEHMDDPDLPAFIELIAERLEKSYWPPGANALARVAARNDAPAAVREQARAVSAAWGVDVVRMTPALTRNVGGTGKQISLQIEVEVRTERPVSICPFVPGRACVDLVLRDEAGREVWRSAVGKADAPRERLDPVFLSAALPDDLADGRYPFEARPGVSVPGLTLPAIRGVLERKAGHWSMPEPTRVDRVIVVPPPAVPTP